MKFKLRTVGEGAGKPCISLNFDPAGGRQALVSRFMKFKLTRGEQGGKEVGGNGKTEVW